MAAKNPKIHRRHVGPNIVRAWFDTVVNPLLLGLSIEKSHLEEKDWTWRFRPNRFEAIRYAKEHVAQEAQDNYDDFVDSHLEVKEDIKLHDEEGVNRLFPVCVELQRLIADGGALQELYSKVTSAESLAEMGTSLQNLFGAYPEEDHLLLLAQYIINNTGFLPDYYSTAVLWNRYRDRFLSILEKPPVAPVYRDAVIVGDFLLSSVNKLVSSLKRERHRLSRQYDVPLVSVSEHTVFSGLQ